jgi:hypothetical protein
MKLDLLPGTPTITGLILTVVIVIWLGLWGPLDLEMLKGWQTLLAAVIAPSIALYAATLAYRGAMAKVELDREEAERKRVANRQGIYLRLRYRTARLASDASTALESLRVFPAKAKMAATYYRPLTEKIEELEEAWKNLELLPPTVGDAVEVLVASQGIMREMANSIEKAEEEMQIEIFTDIFKKNCERVANHSQAVSRYLELAIERLKKFD